MGYRQFKEENWFLSHVLLALLITIILGVLLSSIGCASPAANTLRDGGYTNVTFRGADWRGCPDGVVRCSIFEATGPSGLKVKGYVGCFAKPTPHCGVYIKAVN